MFPDIFIHGILKLRRHLDTETYGRLPWQFCNFTCEITNYRWNFVPKLGSNSLPMILVHVRPSFQKHIKFKQFVCSVPCGCTSKYCCSETQIIYSKYKLYKLEILRFRWLTLIYRHTVTPPINQFFVGALYRCMRDSNLESFDWKTDKFG